MGVRTLNKLSDRGVKTWIAQARTGQKRADGGGLFLTLTPAGTPAWRIKYRLNRRALYAVGTYPSVSLEGAREALKWSRRTCGRGETQWLPPRRKGSRHHSERQHLRRGR